MNLIWASVEPEILLEGELLDFFLLNDSSSLVVISKDMIRVLELPSFRTLRSVPHHIYDPRAAAIDEQGGHIFLAHGNNRELWVFSLESLEKTGELKTSSTVRQISRRAVNQRLNALSFNGLHLISTRNRKPVVSRNVPIQGRGAETALAVDTHAGVSAVARDGKINLHQTDNVSFRRAFDGAPGISVLTYSPDGHLLAGAGGQLVGDPANFREIYQGRELEFTNTDVHLWDSDTGRLLASGSGHTWPVKALAWHPELPLLVSSDGREQIILWKILPETSELVRYETLDLPAGRSGELRRLEFTPDGLRLLAANRHGLFEYRLEDAESLKAQPVPEQAGTAQIGLDFWPSSAEILDSQLWVSSASRWACIDLERGEIVRTGEEDDLTSDLQIDPRSARLLRRRKTSGPDERIEVLTLAGEPVGHVEGIPGSVHSVPMKWLDATQEVAYGVGGRLHVASLDPATPTRSAAFNGDSVNRFSFHAPEGLAVSTSGFLDQKSVRLWNIHTLGSVLLLDGPPLRRFTGWLESSVLSETGLLALGSSKGEVGVFEATTGRLLMQGALHGERNVNDLAFNADGSLLASASDDRTVRLWDPGNGEERGMLHHEHEVRFVRFLPDGRRLVSIDARGDIHLWDAAEGVRVEVIGASQEDQSPRTERERYLEAASQQGLGGFAERSWELFQRTADRNPNPVQPHEDLIDAYVHAQEKEPRFKQAIIALGELFGVEKRPRPGTGVKDANRAIEKMRSGKVLPLDLLAGTLICTSLGQMYEVAGRVMEGEGGFTVVRFRDRMIHKVPSGYGDLQLIVEFEGHLAELKIVHTVIQDMDSYEHRVYEVTRSIQAQYESPPPIETCVSQALAVATQSMYREAWQMVFSQEVETNG